MRNQSKYNGLTIEQAEKTHGLAACRLEGFILGFIGMIITVALGLVFIICLNLLVVRPARKRDEAKNLMLAALRPGAVVYAGGGIRGTVVSVAKDTFTVETSDKKTRLTMKTEALEKLEGFDAKTERRRQSELRKNRMSPSSGSDLRRPRR